MINNCGLPECWVFFAEMSLQIIKEVTHCPYLTSGPPLLLNVMIITMGTDGDVLGETMRTTLLQHFEMYTPVPALCTQLLSPLRRRL